MGLGITDSLSGIVYILHTLYLSLVIKMAAAKITTEVSTVTFTWKDDQSAGPVPAYVYFNSAGGSSPRPIGRICEVRECHVPD